MLSLPPAAVIPDQYIVSLKADVDVEQFARELRGSGRNVLHTYDNALNGLAFYGLNLPDDPRIEFIEPDSVMHTFAQTLPTGVDRIEADLSSTAAIDGTNNPLDVNVAVIDTGVDLDHPDLRVRPASEGFASYARLRGPFIDCGYYTDSPDDDNGHGSHVSGTIAALDNDTGVVGVAPGAYITPVKVLDSSGVGCTSDIIAGINFVTGTRTDGDSTNDVHVANMSLGGVGYSSSMRTAIQNSVAAGVVYTVAAGNDQRDVLGPDGTLGTSDDTSPAAFPEVATISAMADFDGQSGGLDTSTSYAFSDCTEAEDDSFACFSNFSVHQDVNAAHGVDVTSPGGPIDLILPGVGIESTYINGQYETLSGTSMAAPHAAGLAALFIAQHGPATDAAGVYDIRQALIDLAMDQASGNRLHTLDEPDAQPEPLGWAVQTAEPGPSVRTGLVSGVTNSAWTEVTLDHSYASMVVVASANYDESSVPLVPRFRNATGNSFDVRVDRADGLTDSISGVNVHYLVLEEGVYNQADHGITMEARKYTSSLTDHDASWGGEAQTYSNSYTNPVVLGQVMTYNDTDWSVFWSRGEDRTSPPSNATLYTGKHVGEDPDTTRADETVGYIVIESGSGAIGSLDYVAALGPDSVEGFDNRPPYTYTLSDLSSASTAIVSQSAMDGTHGGWGVLYGSDPVTATSLNLAIDEDQESDSERWHTTEQVAYVVFGTAGDSPTPSVRTGLVSGVSNSAWTEVTLDHSYASMVVVASANYDASSVPLVPRIQNAAGNSFEVRVDRADGSTGTISGVNVHYLVLEEGVYNQADHGITMEARKYTSTVTDHDASWGGEAQAYSNSYTSPVVLGQVMTYNDPDWSVFWSHGEDRTSPPSNMMLYTGKHVGEDPDTTRADETIGYIVIESGSGAIGSLDYVAALGPDSVEGFDNRPPYTYTLSDLSSASTAIVSQSAMDGTHGGWGVLYGSDPVTATSLNLAIDEDQESDSERWHTTEQVAYLVFGSASESSSLAATAASTVAGTLDFAESSEQSVPVRLSTTFSETVATQTPSSSPFVPLEFNRQPWRTSPRNPYDAVFSELGESVGPRHAEEVKTKILASDELDQVFSELLPISL